MIDQVRQTKSYSQHKLLPRILAVLLLAAVQTGCSQPVVEKSGDEAKPVSETSAAEGQAKLAVLLKDFAAQAPKDHPILGDRSTLTLRMDLPAAQVNSDSAEGRLHYLKLLEDLATGELRLGNVDKALKYYLEHYEGLIKLKEEMQVPDETITQAAFYLGVAYMRQGESLNCCSVNAPDNCLFPIRGGGVHGRPESSKLAIRYLTEVLQRTKASLICISKPSGC